MLDRLVWLLGIFALIDGVVWLLRIILLVLIVLLGCFSDIFVLDRVL